MYTAEDMMEIEYDRFIHKTLPSYGTGIYEAAGVGIGKAEVAEILYARLLEYG